MGEMIMMELHDMYCLLCGMIMRMIRKMPGDVVLHEYGCKNKPKNANSKSWELQQIPMYTKGGDAIIMEVSCGEG
jgi:hypothetical protein